MITLKKNFEFRRVLSRGKCFNGKFLSIYVFPNKQNKRRFGFAVGKKAGKAVCRNRIRRIIKENIRLLEKEFDIGNDVVCVWKNKTTADKIEFFDIKREISLFIEKTFRKDTDKSEKNNIEVN